MNPRQTSSDSRRLAGAVAAGIVLMVVASDDVSTPPTFPVWYFALVLSQEDSR
jgi:hypothetical protein